MLIVTLVLITVPATALLFLQNRNIQNRLNTLITRELSENLGSRISIKDVSVTFINRFQLKEFYLEDLSGDTLLFSNKIKVTINRFSRNKKEIGIGRIALSSASIHLITRDNEGVNLKFIIDKLSNPEKKDSANWNISISKIQLNESRFRYTSPGNSKKNSPIDFSAMDLRDLNIRINDLVILDDTVKFHINRLGFTEKSGFILSNLNSGFSIGKSHLNFNNTYLETPHSQISANHLYFDFNSFQDFSDFVNKVDLDYVFRSSVVNFSDIAYFTKGLESFSETFRISGDISGSVSDLTAKNILIAYNDHTILGGNMNLIGLPEISETFIYFDMEMFQTNIYDIQNIRLPGNKRISLPENLNGLGTISYTGKFTGYYDDFVAYGTFGSDLGSISTDLLLEPDGNEGLNYRGNIITNSFFLGKIIPENKGKIGNISISAKVDGTFQKKTVSADLTGTIDSLDLYGYTYKNINLSGFLSDKTFDGALNITDPNIQMEFLGKVDFSTSRPNFNFTAGVGRLRPHFLNFKKADPSYFASFLLTSDFTGIHPDSIEGRIDLVNSFFQRSGDQIQVYDFSLITQNRNDSSSIKVRSEIMDIDIAGHYHISKIHRSLKNLISIYLPSLSEDTIAKSMTLNYEDENRFNYSFHFKEIENVARFFTKDIHLANNSTFHGFYSPAEYNVTAEAFFPELGYKENTWNELNLKSLSDSSKIYFTVKSSGLNLNSDLAVRNIALSGTISMDTLTSSLIWDNKESPSYKGNLNLMTGFSDNRLTGNQRISLNIQPSSIVFNDSLWSISPAKIAIDSSSIKVDSFQISNQLNSFLVYGEISDAPGSTLSMKFNDLDLATLNVFTQKIKLNFAGLLNGEAKLINANKNPVFLSDLALEDLYINGQDFGRGELLANYNNSQRGIHMLASGVKGDSEIFRIEGDYFPVSKSIDFDIGFDKIRLSVLEPFTESLVSDLKGLGTGKLKLSGSTDRPELNGTLDLFKASTVVNYLQTRYLFTDKVLIEKNNIHLRNFTITDELGNNAIANGKITSKYFKDFYLGLNIQTQEFLFMNTKPSDNELFHGRVLASGIINITGEPDNLLMDITAKSGRNSVFNIPLYGAEEVNTINFIQFVNSSSAEEEITKPDQNYEVNLRGLSLNFNLEITPDAEVQLIFDPKVGDIIRGRGNGNLTMNISSSGKFQMFGEMRIVEGDYLFTLQNLINKKLEVVPGGRITWNGDPADANIDLKAVYKLRTSVYALSPESGDQLKQRIPVECRINMTGKLLEPAISTEILLPTADQETRDRVNAAINTEEEKLKQFISLLVINNFMSVDPGSSFLSGAGPGSSANVAGVATSELLSNQLSHWLSQISRDFDIGLNYRPGDEITTDELEVALSTQILNDRLTINGNLDVGGNQARQTSSATNASNIAGDFDVDFKITENGKLHLKAFNRSNDNLLFQTSPYTQGVGVFYREDFNSFGELLKRYKDAIIRLFTGPEERKEETSQH